MLGSLAKRANKASAGGQEEQPWLVKSSTATGVAETGTEGPEAPIPARAKATMIKRMANSFGSV
jgi:hypothetical protein